MLEGVLSMQNLISDPVSMTSCRQEAYLLRLRRQFPFVYVKTLTRTAFGRSVYALQFGSGSRKLLITAGHHANETITSDAVWQWLFTFCNALLDGEAVCGAEARELYHNAMVYLVPLVNPDGADLAAGVCASGSPEYRAQKIKTPQKCFRKCLKYKQQKQICSNLYSCTVIIVDNNSIIC